MFDNLWTVQKQYDRDIGHHEDDEPEDDGRDHDLERKDRLEREIQ